MNYICGGLLSKLLAHLHTTICHLLSLENSAVVVHRSEKLFIILRRGPVDIPINFSVVCPGIGRNAVREVGVAHLFFPSTSENRKIALSTGPSTRLITVALIAS